MKPFVKRHKNDAADAEAITEAAQRPTMHFVAVKTEAQHGAGDAALPLVPFGVFSHFRLQSHLQHLSSPFPEEFLQVRPQLVPGYALHLNCRISSHERILSPSLPREL